MKHGFLHCSGQFDLGDESRKFFVADKTRNGAAGFLEAGKIPEIRKIPALLRLDRLHGAIFAVEENALAIWFFLQGKSATVPAQPRELLNKFIFTDVFEFGETGDFFVRQTHLSRPTATGRAALTFIKNWHLKMVSDFFNSPLPQIEMIQRDDDKRMADFFIGDEFWNFRNRHEPRD